VTKGHSPLHLELYWTDLFGSLPTALALLQITPKGALKLHHCNVAFRQLFCPQASRRIISIKQLPADFKLQIQQLQHTTEPQIWRCEIENNRRCLKLQCTRVADPTAILFLLVVHDISEQDHELVQLRQQNDELQQRLADIERLKNRIKEQSIRDPLTNLFNRRFLNEFMERELALARRNQKPLALVMLDLDHFKQLNDQFGHQTGDKVIEMVAKHLLRQSRKTDILFRYGGEEFLVILPNTSALQAKHLAENWRVQVQQAQVSAKHQVVSVTLSAGIACYPEHGTTAFNLIQAADEALYQAKAAGRNQVVMG
jgi:diguanylate cyclase (GGDEF)-like protein